MSCFPDPGAYASTGVPPNTASLPDLRRREARGPSLVDFLRWPPGKPDALGQTLVLQGNADCVVPRVCQIGHSIRHPKDEQNRRVSASRRARITFFDPVERGATDKRALRQQCRRNTPTATCVMDIGAKLAQCGAAGSGKSLFVGLAIVILSNIPSTNST